MENNIEKEKKKSEVPLFIFIFLILGLFVLFLPQINSLISNRDKLQSTVNTNKEVKTPQNIVTDKKDATWFNEYIKPLYIGGYFGNYNYDEPNTGTKQASNANLLNFAIINTVGVDTTDKYEIVTIANNNINTDYAVIPEEEILSIISKYFGKTYTYKPETKNNDEWAYYDTARKSYLSDIVSYTESTEKYNVTDVSYDGYNITLDYNTTMLGTVCSKDYANEDIITGNGELELIYNDGDYNFKSNTYKINTEYDKCWE